MRLKHTPFLLLSIAFGFVATDAQTARPTPRPRPLATPPIVTGAEIISRAEDLGEVSIQPPGPEREVRERSSTGSDVRELTERIKQLEAGRKDPYDEKQKRMLLNLDILTRAEQRSESLRKQLFEMIEKESTVKTRLEQIEYDGRPEVIERALQLSGSMRPEEVRDNRRRTLVAEKANLQSLLTEIQSTRANLTTNVLRADQMVERLRLKLEKDIEDSFLKEDDPNDQ